MSTDQYNPNWSTLDSHLLFYVVSIDEISTIAIDKKKTSVTPDNVSLRISYGKSKWKTVPFVFDRDHIDVDKYGSFGVELDEEEQNVLIELVTVEKGLKKPKVMGHSTVSLAEITPDVVNEQWIDLYIKDLKGIEKKVNSFDSDVGSVHIRFYYSTIKSDYRSNYVREIDEDIYSYDDIKDSVKTGDIILFNENGFNSTILKLYGNCNFNRAGMVIKLPNKYTEIEKLYVIEITRNMDKFYDAFKEYPVNGVNIFRLWERVHEFPGTSIHLLPLDEELMHDPTENMIEWLLSLHEKPLPELETVFSDFPPAMWEILNDFSISIKQRTELYELNSTEMCVKALVYGGKRLKIDDIPLLTPNDLLTFDCFRSPIVLRSQFK